MGEQKDWNDVFGVEQRRTSGLAFPDDAEIMRIEYSQLL